LCSSVHGLAEGLQQHHGALWSSVYPSPRRSNLVTPPWRAERAMSKSPVFPASPVSRPSSSLRFSSLGHPSPLRELHLPLNVAQESGVPSNHRPFAAMAQPTTEDIGDRDAPSASPSRVPRCAEPRTACVATPSKDTPQPRRDRVGDVATPSLSSTACPRPRQASVSARPPKDPSFLFVIRFWFISTACRCRVACG
jgi:hypothetical protein